MGVARARRIALRVHRGVITKDGELVTEFLARVVDRVASLGGGWAAQQAAWLHLGPSPDELARLRFPARVLRVLEKWHHGGSLRDPDATLIHDALRACSPVRPTPSPQPDEIDDLPALLAEYRAAQPNGVGQVRSRIFELVRKPLNARSPLVTDLIEEWWDSAHHWESYLALHASNVAGGVLGRERLLIKAASDQDHIAQEAIHGLTGDADPREIEILRSVISHQGLDWRFARDAAAARLREIGGPDAEAALQERAYGWSDAPWLYDRDWLHLHGTGMVPRFIEWLADPQWNHAAPFALGELRAVEAVGPLCESAKTSRYYPVVRIEALGKIGSRDAVPTLLELLGHSDPDVRDHVLRALVRIGGPEVVDAAVAACDDPHPLVRDRAARVLAKHGDERAVTALIRLCDTKHAAAAADALGRIGDPRALPALWALFRHPDKAVRYAAGRALARIEGPSQWVHSWEGVEIERAFMWLLGHKPEWADWSRDRRLLDSTKHADPIVRAHAATAYARLRHPEGAANVRPLLDDPDPRVRSTARAALNLLDG